MSAPLLQVIIGSTRPGRVGLPVAQWFTERASAHGGFDVELVDLAEVGLPLLDEPHHPRLQNYTKEHTRRWSATVSRADAFVLVTPEYNFSFGAALKNALDFLSVEWRDKPVAFVSYGGISGGMRSVQMLKQVVSALSMVPIVEAVTIPFVAKALTEDRSAVVSTESLQRAATALLDELLRYANALEGLR